MPHLTLTLSPAGPLVDVTIGVSKPRHDALVKAGQPIPAFAPARLLVDTGASGTCLDCSVIQKLGLIPTGQAQVHTPSTGGTAGHAMNQYDVALFILAHGIRKSFLTLPVMEADFSAQNIDGLFGRDVLAQCLLVYSGPDNAFMLSV